jgi:hypothetical protein
MSTTAGRSSAPGSNVHNQRASEPVSSTNSQARRALLMAETIFARLRTMPASYQPLDIRLAILRHDGNRNPRTPPELLALAQDGDPRHAA